MENSTISRVKSIIVVTIFFILFHSGLIPAEALGGRRKKIQAGDKARSSVSSGQNTIQNTIPNTIQNTIKNTIKNTISINAAGNNTPVGDEGEGAFHGSLAGALGAFREDISGVSESDSGSNLASEAIRLKDFLSSIAEGEGTNRPTVREKVNGLTSLAGRVSRRFGTIGQDTKIPDHSPALVSDDKGTLYLVCEHGNELWWAVNNGSGWTHNGKLPGEGGNRPVVIYIPGLFGDGLADQEAACQEASGQQSAPVADAGGGLFCIWESLESPKKIMSSVGKLSGEEVIWSEPQALTKDDNSDCGLALTVDSHQNPIVLWLQQASPENDDSDLYYQVITSAGSNPNWVGQGQETLTQQQQSQQQQSQQQQTERQQRLGGSFLTPDATIPVYPFGDVDCLVRVLKVGGHFVPKVIPVIGGPHSYQLLGNACVPGMATNPAALPFSGDSAAFALGLFTTFGKHITTGTVGGIYIQRNVPPNPELPESSAPGNSSDIEANSPDINNDPSDPNNDPSSTNLSDVYTVSGASYLSYLSFPLPWRMHHVPVGKVRMGIVTQTGVQGTIIFRQGSGGQQSAAIPSFLSLLNNSSEAESTSGAQSGEQSNAYSTLKSGFPKTLEGSELVFDVGVGGEGTINTFKGGVAGTVFLIGGLTTKYTIPANAEATFTAAPFIALTGFVGAFGTWSGVIKTFHRSYTLDRMTYSSSGSSAAALSPIVSSSKDKLVQKIYRFLGEGVSLREEIECVKKPFTGTGSIYEGKPVLGDISADVYNDGVPSVARSESGEIIAVWAKALAASALGSKIYAATYTADTQGWSSPVEVTPAIAFHKDPAAVFDSRGKLMVVWSGAVNDGLDYEQSSVEEILQAIDKADLMYSQEIEGKWTVPKLLATLTGLDEQVNLAAGPNGEIMAVWINQSDNASLLYGSLWNGTRWTEPKLISKSALAESPAVIYTAQKASVVWAEDKDGQADTTDDWGIYLSSWDGTSWHSPQSLSLGDKKEDQKSVLELGKGNLRQPVITRRKRRGRRGVLPGRRGTDLLNE